MNASSCWCSLWCTTCCIDKSYVYTFSVLKYILLCKTCCIDKSLQVHIFCCKGLLGLVVQVVKIMYPYVWGPKFESPSQYCFIKKLEQFLKFMASNFISLELGLLWLVFLPVDLFKVLCHSMHACFVIWYASNWCASIEQMAWYHLGRCDSVGS